MLLRYASVRTFILERGIFYCGGVIIFLAMAKGELHYYMLIATVHPIFLNFLLQTSTLPPPGNL